MDYRIEKRDAFKVIAKKQRFCGGAEITQNQIGATWQAAGADGTLETLCQYIRPGNMFGDTIVGICFDDSNQGDFDYAIGVAYEDGTVAENLTIETVPAHTWIVFGCTGPMPDAFLELMKKIYTEFFPTSRYQPHGGMCIEAYPSSDVHSNDFNCEIWFSVTAKEQ